ncbi:hypothetical protein Trco_000219 [Trichoderma cornu-damae]|uniref:Pre-rRNA processing protein n=1 Tax=Trichoderma cornu-damae TaxID=654480 RepID=A0A9P8QRZ2_9HYPO|nr:hypothetical protein Trco_000219 [Trichoderma cornu-damae]
MPDFRVSISYNKAHPRSTDASVLGRETSEPSETSPLLSSEPELGPVTEASPLLSDAHHRQEGGDDEGDSLSKSPSKPGSRWRWPSIIAIAILAALTVAVMVLGFLVPPAVKLYAETAAVLEPTGLSLESLTSGGVRARIQANFKLDGSRVKDDTARRLGRLATSIVRKLDTEETHVRVHLPRYANALLGSAVVPPLAISLVDGQTTELDFVADASPGDIESLRQLVNDWLDGKLQQVKVTGSAALRIKTGFLPLGTHKVVESMVFEATEIPSLPEYKIDRLNIRDVPTGDGGRMAVGANASIIAYNDHPVGLTVPQLAFDILVPNCDPSESYIVVAAAITQPIDVEPHANVTVDAIGLINDIPDTLTRACPLSKMSPLDNFFKHYMSGEDAQVFVRGQDSDKSKVPEWIKSFLNSVTVPISFPGRSFDDAIRNLSLTDVDFKLPSPFADPNDPDSKPRVSGTIQALAELPSELNVDIGVNSLRASGDIFYDGKKFGELNVQRWQKANSSKVADPEDEKAVLKITSRISNVPLDITDGDVFSEVMGELLLGDKDILLDVESLVDVKVSTVLGDLVIRDVPAKGKLPVKQLPGKSLTKIDPRVSNLVILNTTKHAVHMQASLNITNPTPYTASIPFATVHVYHKGLLIGEVTASHLDLQLGNNTNLAVSATWDPVALGGEESHKAATKLLSDYLSGKNTTLTFRTHKGSIPGAPIIGDALSRFNITLPTPRIKLPGDKDGRNQGKTFVRDAVFHVFSSTASFCLASPLKQNIIHIEKINATAYYNHTEPVGHILYDEPFDAPPGVTETPRLPVMWSADSIGYDKLIDAMDGSLKLDAKAEATLRIGNWIETVHYEGRGIGARVRL